MRQSRFTEAQIIGVIKEQEAEAPAGGHDARQRRVEGFAGKELTTPNMRRAAAGKAMRDHHLSQRRACRLVGVDPKTVRRDQPPAEAPSHGLLCKPLPAMVERLSNLRAPRTTRLPKTKPQNMKSKPQTVH